MTLPGKIMMGSGIWESKLLGCHTPEACANYELARPEDAEAYFAITPQRTLLSNVIHMEGGSMMSDVESAINLIVRQVKPVLCNGVSKRRCVGFDLAWQ
jgi:hypothetical protein